jgi:hypothetical protein
MYDNRESRTEKKITLRIPIGNSDYTRSELECDVWGWGVSSDYFLKTIQAFEDAGCIVRFETSLFRRIFGIAKYKVVAYK